MEFGMRSVRGEKALRSWRIVGVASTRCFENRNLVQRFRELGVPGSKYRILPVEDKRRKRKYATIRRKFFRRLEQRFPRLSGIR